MVEEKYLASNRRKRGFLLPKPFFELRRIQFVGSIRLLTPVPHNTVGSVMDEVECRYGVTLSKVHTIMTGQ